MKEKEVQIYHLNARLDSIENTRRQSARIYRELKIQYPQVERLVFEPMTTYSDSSQTTGWTAVISSKKPLKGMEKKKIKDWLEVRTETTDIDIYYEP